MYQMILFLLFVTPINLTVYRGVEGGGRKRKKILGEEEERN